MEYITHLTARFVEMLPELAAEFSGEVEATDLVEVEQAVQELGRTLGRAVIQQVLESGPEEKYPERERTCPHCGGQARYVRKREGVTITLQGRVRYRRAYYQCEVCHRGHYPRDEALQIRPGQMSEMVLQVAGRVGSGGAFERGSELLAELVGLELSPNSVRKACQVLGERVIAREEATYIESQDLERQREHRRMEAPERMYLAMDGFMAPFRDGWHEVKCLVWWEEDAEGRVMRRHYVADTASAEEFSDLVWASGFAQLADQARELVVISDGAAWIENIVRQHFPHAVSIVDWYHARSYLFPVAEAAFPDAAERKAWLERTTQALWHGHVQQVIEACRTWVRPDLPPDKDPAQRAVTYFTNQAHRMDYPTYRQRGYPMGSGMVESLCKRLGKGRLALAGARWHVDRATARSVLKVRAAHLSKRTDLLQPYRQIA
jgi:hypothetical protein